VYSVPVHCVLLSGAAGACRNDAGALFISVERRALYDMQSADRLHCDLYTVYVCLSVCLRVYLPNCSLSRGLRVTHVTA